MARGWESKSVEQQIEERDQFTGPLRNAHADAARERELEVLRLARLRLLHEIETAASPRFRELKKKALDHVEKSIAALA
jgi:hypothetical protein